VRAGQQQAAGDHPAAFERPGLVGVEAVLMMDHAA
jgi:hypothetical protein